MKCMKAVCAAGLVVASGVSAHSLTEAESNFLKDIDEGKVSKEDLEVVLAQHSEDVSWSRPYNKVLTIYCKGGSKCAEGAVPLSNVGREGHSFLHHIVKNYDKLAKWTVFSQAEAPSEGYFGHGHGGGHLLSGARFEDYLLQPMREKDSDAMFLMTSKVHLPTLAHAFRSTFKVRPEQQVPLVPSRVGMCPASAGSDKWGSLQDVAWLKSFVQAKCGIEDFGAAASAFWDDYVQLPMPRAGLVHYAQGARFAASRERILQRPKAFYERLLQAVGSEEDPCLNYLYEMSWYYMIGKPTGLACEVSEEEAVEVPEVHRQLAAHEGVSGGGSDGSSKAPSGNVNAAPGRQALAPIFVAGAAVAALL